jgi:hypothetical protein
MIFDAPGSYIRDAIRGLRQNGNPVGSGYKGYFWAETADELMATLKGQRLNCFCLFIYYIKIVFQKNIN